MNLINMFYMIAFKILTETELIKFLTDGVFTGNELDKKDGYIHMSTTEKQINRIINKYYSNTLEMIYVLEIDLSKLHGVKFEAASDGELYPHQYGDLRKTCVLSFKPRGELLTFLNNEDKIVSKIINMAHNQGFTVDDFKDLVDFMYDIPEINESRINWNTSTVITSSEDDISWIGEDESEYRYVKRDYNEEMANALKEYYSLTIAIDNTFGVSINNDRHVRSGLWLDRFNPQ